MIPESITGHYAGPVSGILLPELEPLLLSPRGGYLMSSGFYPRLEQHNGLWSLVRFLDTFVLTFCPHDELVVYGKSVDIWRADDSEESRSYYLLDSLHFPEPVLSVIDSLEEPLL